MRVKQITTFCAAVIMCAYAPLSLASHEEAGHKWVPNHPQNTYWQAPEWSGVQKPQIPAPSATQALPNYRTPQVTNNPMMPMPRTAPPPPNLNRGYPPPPRGPYQGPNQRPYYGPNNGASAYNIPGYQRNRGNRWSNNKFWGRSGPRTWMNPSKENWERGWDDMINSPSRMGTMPGGWNAPEVSMPNPIDMGDQIQDNAKDLPQQMRDMNVGNEVN